MRIRARKYAVYVSTRTHNYAVALARLRGIGAEVYEHQNGDEKHWHCILVYDTPKYLFKVKEIVGIHDPRAWYVIENLPEYRRYLRNNVDIHPNPKGDFE